MPSQYAFEAAEARPGAPKLAPAPNPHPEVFPELAPDALDPSDVKA
jgi:hypothetical protein